MKIKSKVASTILIGALIAGNISLSFADSARVVTLGANLSKEQRQIMLDFFGVKENEVILLEVNNQEERKYLEGIATEAQLGKKTFSCSYVEPTKKGSGINVKTANLNWLTSSLVASTLSSAGITDANVVVAANFEVSGTGALTGILKGLSDAYGISLDEDKKEIASEELIITGTIGEEIGTDKATGIINDIKIDIIKNNTKDTTQIAETINNVTNNYNVTLNIEQQKDIEQLMTKIAKQDYNYKEMKHTLEGIKDTIEDKLDSIGEGIDKSFFERIKDWFSNVKKWFVGIFNSNKTDLGILENTNDSILGENTIIDSTSEEAINIQANESEGLFDRIWNWFKGLFENKDNLNEELKEDTPIEGTELNETIIEEEHFEFNDNEQDSGQTEDNTTTTDEDNLDSSSDETNINESDITDIEEVDVIASDNNSNN